ncbi:MAG: ABC transporter substrate-binding protein [Cetobacterium sp.]|uniref:ABC transporter substrate-binding protein n=1 Tax=Cetobacterium sp. TaxID=2071632 RepID=UPI0025F03000|nr:extracellular solute-binding protein [uncultured Cetobacterium sp.]
MKKIILSLALSGLLLSCNKSEDTPQKKTLVITSNSHAQEPSSIALQEIIDEYTKSNPEIKIDFIPGSSDYEETMKTKMATNSLPDIFATHGWSINRYKEYLEPLNDREWAQYVSPAIKPVITDTNEKFYVLPLDVDIVGLPYNLDVLEKAGVDPKTIKTTDDFLVALEKVKNIGVTPIYLGGKDSASIGNIYDWIAPGLIILTNDNPQGENLKNGIFDEKAWNITGEFIKTLKDNGYINRDALTGNDAARALGTGKAAFLFFGTSMIREGLTYNPDARMDFIALPTKERDQKSYFITGERLALGAWKDSPNKKEALDFLDYLAKPENISKMATANVLPTGLTNAKSDLGKFESSYDLGDKYQYVGFFDREYLPSGAWETLCSIGAGIISGQLTVEEASKKMKEDFDKLKNK